MPPNENWWKFQIFLVSPLQVIMNPLVVQYIWKQLNVITYISRSNIQRGIANYKDFFFFSKIFLKILTSNTLLSNLMKKQSIYWTFTLMGQWLEQKFCLCHGTVLLRAKEKNMNKTKLFWAQYYSTRFKTLLKTLKYMMYLSELLKKKFWIILDI